MILVVPDAGTMCCDGVVSAIMKRARVVMKAVVYVGRAMCAGERDDFDVSARSCFLAYYMDTGHERKLHPA